MKKKKKTIWKIGDIARIPWSSAGDFPYFIGIFVGLKDTGFSKIKAFAFWLPDHILRREWHEDRGFYFISSEAPIPETIQKIEIEE